MRKRLYQFGGKQQGIGPYNQFGNTRKVFTGYPQEVDVPFINNWNNFQNWLGEKKYAGDPRLDTDEQYRSQVLGEFNKMNNLNWTDQDILRGQKAFNTYYNWASQNNPNDPVLQGNQPLKEEGILGQYTSNKKYLPARLDSTGSKQKIIQQFGGPTNQLNQDTTRTNTMYVPDWVRKVAGFIPGANAMIDAAKNRDGLGAVTGAFQTIGSSVGAGMGLGSTIGGFMGGNKNSPMNMEAAQPAIFQMGGPMLTKVNGPSHTEGGIQMGNSEVEGNEVVQNKPQGNKYIYSDSIRLPGEKKTIAQQADYINKKLEMRPNDSITKNWSRVELKDLEDAQEGAKMNYMMNNVPGVMQYGGELSKSAQGSIPEKKGPALMEGNVSFGKKALNSIRMDEVKQSPDQPNLDRYTFSAAFGTARKMGLNTFLYKGKTYNTGAIVQPPGTMQYGGGIDPLAPVIPQGPDTLGLTMGDMPNSMSPVNFTPSQLATIPNRTQSPVVPSIPPVAGGQGANPMVPQSPPGEYNPNFGLGIAGSMFGPLANITAAAFSKGSLMNPKIQYDRINNRPAEVLAEQQAANQTATSRDAFRNLSPTAGSFLTNMGITSTNNAAALGRNIADINLKGQQMNQGIQMQETNMNQAITSGNNAMRDADRARRWQLAMEGAAGIGNNLMGINRDINANRSQNTALKFLNTPNYRIKYDSKGNPVGIEYMSGLPNKG